ncbi:ABC transporter substrate-binding protein [Halosimplex aquaticum]
MRAGGEDTPTEGDGGGDGEGDGGTEDTPESDGETETSAATGDAPASRTIKVGILMGVTGGLSELGPPIRQAAELAAEHMDRESDTFTVDYQFEDTATDPNTGISSAEALVSADYPMVAGALSSTVTIQTANNVLVPNGVVQCSPASTSPQLSNLEDNGYLWRTTPGDGLQAAVMTTVGRDRLDAQSTATLALNNDYGQGLAAEYVSAWEEAGGTVQNEVSFEPGQGSYTSQLSSALQDQPDLLMIVGYPESGVRIFRDFYSDYSQDFCDIIVPDGLQSGSLPGNVGNSMRNVWGTAPSSTGPGRDAFDSLYQEEFDSDPSESRSRRSRSTRSRSWRWRTPPPARTTARRSATRWPTSPTRAARRSRPTTSPRGYRWPPAGRRSTTRAPPAPSSSTTPATSAPPPTSSTATRRAASKSSRTSSTPSERRHRGTDGVFFEAIGKRQPPRNCLRTSSSASRASPVSTKRFSPWTST